LLPVYSSPSKQPTSALARRYLCKLLFSFKLPTLERAGEEFDLLKVRVRGDVRLDLSWRRRGKR
jgi:hypothetical protein